MPVQASLHVCSRAVNHPLPGMWPPSMRMWCGSSEGLGGASVGSRGHVLGGYSAVLQKTHSWPLALLELAGRQ